MTVKLSALGFSLLTALSTPALAHETYANSSHASNRHAPRIEPPPWYETPPQRADWTSHPRHDITFRYSDGNRDGWVTLAEALERGRFDFRRSDRDRNRVLTPREVERGELIRHDRNRDGRMSLLEHQSDAAPGGRSGER